MSDGRDAEAIALSRAALDAALEDFASGARERKKRLHAFLGKLDHEHKRATRALRAPVRAFALALDPERLLFSKGDLTGAGVLDAVLPNWDPGSVNDTLGELADDMPSDEVSDALDDLRQAETDAADQYGAGDGDVGSDDDE